MLLSEATDIFCVSDRLKGSRILVRLTKREFLRHDETSGGSVVATWRWVVVAEASYESGGFSESLIVSSLVLFKVGGKCTKGILSW
jgi:hypothetical protein